VVRRVRTTSPTTHEGDARRRNRLIVGGDGGAPTRTARTYPHRFSATASAKGGVTFVDSAFRRRNAARRLSGRRQRPYRPRPRSRAGRARSGSAFDGVVTRRRAVRPKGAGRPGERAVGILFVADVHNHPGPGNFEVSARNYWPAQLPRIERYTLAEWPRACAFR
jgi:hypothetical protein